MFGSEDDGFNFKYNIKLRKINFTMLCDVLSMIKVLKEVFVTILEVLVR